MPAADETDLVAALLAGPALATAALEAWDGGVAILPVNPDLPRAAITALLETTRPTVILDADGRRPVRGGVPAAHGTAAVVATSGTTGEPKGVELTRTGMEAMARGYSAALAADERDRWLACLPLHHVASLGALARAYVTGAGWLAHERFELARVARAPREEGATIVSLVPTALRRLLDAGAPLHEYRRVIVGGAPCPAALRTRAEDVGVAVVDAYGMSETWGGWVIDGIPIAGARHRLAPDGEILVRGEMVMRGYRLAPQPTAAVLDPDGWLHTGDLGVEEHGHLRVVDRKKDLVISGGVNVSPTEVEAVLGRHLAVADVCVVGAPDAQWGERVVAYVVPVDPGAPPVLEQLRAFAREQLAAAKLPKELRIVAEIPRSPSGKALRRLL